MLLYPALKHLLISLILTLLGSVIPSVGGLLTLAGFVFMVLALREIQAYHPRLKKAYYAFITSVWLVLVSVFVIAIGTAIPILILIGTALTLIGTIVAVYADFHLYGGLNDLVISQSYAYPAGKILWCFWLSLIGLILFILQSIWSTVSLLYFSSSVSSLFNLLFAAASCVLAILEILLVYQLSQVVRASENQ